MQIKNKIINHLLIKGKKNKSEKILLKSSKKLLKLSKKSNQKVFQLALVAATPIFKVSEITQKKRKKKKQRSRIIPAFLYSKKARASSAIRYIVKTTQEKRTRSLFSTFSEELSLTAQYQGNAIESKKSVQKQAFNNKHLFKYYRWH